MSFIIKIKMTLTNLILHTTPPDPPDSSATKFRMNSPVLTSHNFTVPSSELVITKRLLNCRHVTAEWCLLRPKKYRFRYWLFG